eukprot:4175530-Ditylum_brightwellii.AAC.1
MDDLTTCQYGFCLLRMLHCIAYLHTLFPLTHILINKYNMEKVYHCKHTAGRIAAACIAIVQGI